MAGGWSQLAQVHQHILAESAGSYICNGFLIRLHRDNRTFSKSPPIPSEHVAVFVHEYLHYLHNISTMAGLWDFIANVRLVKLFVETLQADGTSAGSEKSPFEFRESVAQHISWLAHMRGEKKPRDVGFGIHRGIYFAKVNDVSRIRHEFNALGPSPMVIETANLELEITSSNCDATIHHLEFGSHSIFEGIAWEIEKLLLAGENVDLSVVPVPRCPYGVMRDVYEHYSGVEASPIHLIRTGLLALQSNEPGSSFVGICEQLSLIGFPNSEDEYPPAIIEVVMRNLKESTSKTFEDCLIPLLDSFRAVSSTFSTAFDELRNQMTVLFTRRAEDPLFELGFIDPVVNVEKLWPIIQGIPPCPVIQLNQDGNALTIFDGRAELPADLSAENRLIEAMGVYQSMQALVHAHTNPAGRFESTLSLEQFSDRFVSMNQCTCPFFGCCAAPQALEHAEICQKRPWRSPTRSSMICWYASAIGTLTKSAHGQAATIR